MDRNVDLELASACIAGDPAALAVFERDHLAPAAEALRRAGYDRALVDDAIQLVRYRLLVATPQREAKLATYRGTGSLSGWLRVTALRQARALLGPRVKSLASSRDAVAPEVSLVGRMVVRDHGPRLRELLQAAIAALDDKPREALRLEVVEGLPHHQIAALWKVHRTTVVRWIEEARTAIATAIRSTIRADLAIGSTTADSVLQALAGIDISIASAFRHAP